MRRGDSDRPVGICQRQANRPAADRISSWEGRRERELTQAVLHRHQKAKLLCATCPVLEACERYLSDMERQDSAVEGVVAGRYSDVASWWRRGKPEEAHFVQEECRSCHQRMRPQAPERRNRRHVIKRHVGEGMCDQCYPKFSRAARRSVA